MDFTGTLLTASDVEYDKARSVWNGASFHVNANIRPALQPLN